MTWRAHAPSDEPVAPTANLAPPTSGLRRRRRRRFRRRRCTRWRTSPASPSRTCAWRITGRRRRSRVRAPAPGSARSCVGFATARASDHARPLGIVIEGLRRHCQLRERREFQAPPAPVGSPACRWRRRSRVCTSPSRTFAWRWCLIWTPRCSTCSGRRRWPSDRSRKRRRRWTSWDSRRRQDRQRERRSRRRRRAGRAARGSARTVSGRQPLAGGRGRRAGGRSRGGRTKAQIAGRDVGFRTDEDRRVRGAVGVVHRPRLSHHGDAHGAVSRPEPFRAAEKKISSPTSSGRRRRRSNRRGDAWDRRCRTASTPCFDPETKTTRGMRLSASREKSEEMNESAGRGVA